MMWSTDPLRDFDRWSEAQEEQAKACPICKVCGDRITDETGYVVRMCGKDYRFHTDCVETFYVDDYIAEHGSLQERMFA